jgi:hypothetical protein
VKEKERKKRSDPPTPLKYFLPLIRRKGEKEREGRGGKRVPQW